jgi:BlaI family transcriptional regulator, penicillinase repressor
MAKKIKQHTTNQVVPTQAELEVLKILWKHGPSTVRFVHDTLSDNKDIGYTSTLKTMQVMIERGMLKREGTYMSHVYYPLLEEAKTLGSILDRFVHSVYNGSVSKLLVALMNNDTSPEERKKLKELLAKMEKNT